MEGWWTPVRALLTPRASPGHPPLNQTCDQTVQRTDATNIPGAHVSNGGFHGHNVASRQSNMETTARGYR
eukprot:56302-Pelagomonas_calceolata.AAC.1